jgi:hypothetical protein
VAGERGDDTGSGLVAARCLDLGAARGVVLAWGEGGERGAVGLADDETTCETLPTTCEYSTDGGAMEVSVVGDGGREAVGLSPHRAVSGSPRGSWVRGSAGRGGEEEGRQAGAAHEVIVCEDSYCFSVDVRS